ncbi:hypothetical protein PG996_008705 [Apiospora saccharicola]|uniref:Uncharacterized protein n=1 Tax=Apiospora saccharicola TaxID=335842 RepID=A0ABR1V201_9PEZI
MEPESANKEIEGWVGSGLMVPARIMERLDVEAADGRALSEEEQVALQKTLSAMEGHALSPAAFLNLLQTRVGFPIDSPQSKETANVLFRCLWYLSTIPFPPTASEGHSPPRNLTIAQTTRGLAWLFPGRCRVMIGQGNLSRSRTAADHRRLLFQSLATTTLSPSGNTADTDAEARENRAARNATEGLDPYQDWPVVNRDADGDEIFHDLLEVLYATQPKGPVWLASVDRDGFRWVAKGIVAQLPSSSSPPKSIVSNKLPSLDSLAIPRARLETLVKLALAAAFLMEQDDCDTEDEENEAEQQTKPVVQLSLSEVDDAALKRVLAPFCGQGKATELVSWPMFDDALRDNVSRPIPTQICQLLSTMQPELFHPLYEVVSRALFDQPWEMTV